ncbi:MAG: hypothetical protein ACE5H3_11205 [Planctomycetota bacterium]
MLENLSDFCATTHPNSVGPMRFAAFLDREQGAALLADVAGFTREFLSTWALE